MEGYIWDMTLDTVPWDLFGIAGALVRRADGSTRTGREHSGLAPPTAAIEEELTTCLGSTVEEFLSALDPFARASATGGAGFCMAVYNFLVHPTHDTYRRQFAETFPGLVPKVVNAARDNFGAELLEIIDSGRPVVRSLAVRWQVRPGVVRHLIGKPIDLVGEHWVMRMPQLAAILNAQILEDMPGDPAGRLGSVEPGGGGRRASVPQTGLADRDRSRLDTVRNARAKGISPHAANARPCGSVRDSPHGRRRGLRGTGGRGANGGTLVGLGSSDYPNGDALQLFMGQRVTF